MPRQVGIADARQHICNRIVSRHRFLFILLIPKGIPISLSGAAFFVGVACGDYGNVHATDLVNAVVLNLWKNLALTPRVIAATIKALGLTPRLEFGAAPN